MPNQILTGEKVVVQNGKVVEYENWEDWNGTLWRTVQLQRLRKSFRLTASTPDGGDPPKTGPLDRTISKFRPEIQERLRRLMLLVKPSVATIHNAGFQNAEIEFQI